jgi:hypothetical protein
MMGKGGSGHSGPTICGLFFRKAHVPSGAAGGLSTAAATCSGAAVGTLIDIDEIKKIEPYIEDSDAHLGVAD